MHKSFPAQIKAAGSTDGLEEGQFQALVSVFGNKDAMGDVIAPGAFTDTLAEWGASGDRIPVYWSHQMQDPDYNIGWVESATETADGLEVVASLDLSEGTSSKARQVYRLLKGRRVTQFSFAYDVLDGGPVEKDGEEFNELRALKLYELGPTPIGANPATELLAVKHAADAARDAAVELKRGRVLSAKNESTLTDALASISAGVASIKNVLSTVADSGDDGKASTTQEKASETGPATDKEPPGEGATTKEPNRATPAKTLAIHLELLDLEGSQ
jgi:HK97 family phage prohead protease